MKRDGEWPLVEGGAQALGVRTGTTLAADIAVDDLGDVHPGTGGMSVNAAWRTLPYWRIPRRLKHLLPEARGNDQLVCWRHGQGDFESATVAEGLNLRVDRFPHGLVEPSRIVPLHVFEAALGATRTMWTVDEE